MLSVDGITVAFGDLVAVDHLSLEVRSGEIMAVLGPSGCGKSTLLRAVAGLQPLNSGEVRYDGEDLAAVPVHRRDFGLMFQEHALFPHRNVADNVAFGLKVQRMGASLRRRRVREMLDLVGLRGFEDREVLTLSGGEAQRVALARSLAAKPRLLMLDEPLGSLDRPRREELTDELRTLLRQVGVTVLHVTHDHDEAFAVADRVAVMHEGRALRVGTPAETWRDPRDEHVARFLGHENLVSVGRAGSVPWGRLSVEPGRVVVRSDAFRRIAQDPAGPPPPAAAEAASSEASVEPSVAAPDTVTGTVTDTRFRGAVYELRISTIPGDFELTVLDPRPAARGDRLAYTIDPSLTMHLR